MSTDRAGLIAWSQRWSVSSGAVEAVLDRLDAGPAVPPFTGLPHDARRELVRLPLAALSQLRELTDADPAAHRASALVPGRAPAAAWSVLDAVDQAVCVADMRAPDAPIVYVNPAFTRTTGYHEEEVLGRNCRFLHDGLLDPSANAELDALGTSSTEVAAAVQRIRELLAAGEAGEVVLVNRHADGHVFVNELALSPVMGADGAPRHYVAVQRDVTSYAVVRRARAALADELDQTARAVQASLVPSTLPDLTGWTVATGYQPATRADGERGAVSGDFFDVFAGPAGAGGSWYAVIGDVSGRGPRAAASTSALRWSLRGAATTHHDPAALLHAVGDAVHEQLGDRFATMAALALPLTEAGGETHGEIDVVVSLALAGHPQPVLLPASGPPRLVGLAGTLLGPFADIAVEQEQLTVGPGDQLVLYTDGVTEATDARGRQLGEQGLLEVLAGLAESERTCPDAAQRTVAAVTAAVTEHVAGGPVDDLTLLVVARPAG
ncbi:PAS domain S-box-containing protein [Quadrisphaera granulorum]|uniref:PAS domain S-box-containing protein n=1 Tax=Quadrisphaera granulorum TaxID=317664 RepID=A0A316A6S4_9ACTN|nr:SpoIIE family protein phosphatase [Quadrisphaera granulorum]PWJ52680.1 PAS domain S-box-containing protein [Quadrisphaera granulorum]SZE97502.1 PAS domain S-box-containing protein [Quadrisphaera granulorum]